jgi:hypothetical protein
VSVVEASRSLVDENFLKFVVAEGAACQWRLQAECQCCFGQTAAPLPRLIRSAVRLRPVDTFSCARRPASLATHVRIAR